MRELFNFCRKRFMDSRHFILCDSAFFLNMPEYARAYAIGFEYTEAGLVRYPRNGIVHEWAVKRLIAIKGPNLKKIITIFLNGGADVVALKDGRPVMTSQGFSDFDGIMSQTGCGLIDTSIVFRLFSAGYSLESIYQVLSQESGFKALVGEKLRLSDLIVRRDIKAREAMDIFSYQLIKTIGACGALLEGVDSIVFIGDDQKEIQDWTYHFLRHVEFLGLKRHKKRINKDTLLMTADSPIEAYYFGFDKWSVMSQLLQVIKIG
jgi:acetate kinase